MSKHLKSRIIRRLKSVGCTFVSLSAGSTPHARGVHYFRFSSGVDGYWGTMDYEREGRKYKKRIIVRPSRFRDGLFELYTYHCPKHWSAACVANREIIKEAQRQAHALERDHSFVALEWRIRFFRHYFAVFKGGAKPEPGMKPYSRFYQYTYVALYRQLKAAAQEHPAASSAAHERPASLSASAKIGGLTPSSASANLGGLSPAPAEPQQVTFEPIPQSGAFRPLCRLRDGGTSFHSRAFLRERMHHFCCISARPVH